MALIVDDMTYARAPARRVRRDQEQRWPLYQSVALVIGVSAGFWALLYLGVRILFF